MASEQPRERFPSAIRPVDPWLDLSGITDLIELGFQEELDPQGRKMLIQLRKLINRNAWNRRLDQIFGEQYLGPTGFVWCEGSRIVGNLSLRRAHARRPNGWMIGNVVVHPDYRGRGIGRMLMEAALDTVAEYGGRWIGLEVRADNPPARHLYETLGFETVGQTAHLLRPADLPWPPTTQWPSPAPMNTWRSSRPEQARTWLALADAIYGLRQMEVLEIRSQLYIFGELERQIDLWLQGEREAAWLWGREGARLGVIVRTDNQYRFHVWDLLIHPQSGEFGVQMALARALHAVRHRPPWPTVTLIPPSPPLLAALEKMGFRLHRTLLQMQYVRN